MGLNLRPVRVVPHRATDQHPLPPPNHQPLKLMRTDDLDFVLPPERIATAPATPRDSAKLMVFDRATQSVRHCQVRDLPDLGVLQAGDVMITNNSRVLPARFTGTRDATGGHVAGLYLHPTAPEQADGLTGCFETLLESGGKPQPGETITLTPCPGSHAARTPTPTTGTATLHCTFTLIQKLGQGRWTARCSELKESPAEQQTIEAALAELGATPLPPYIRAARKTLGLPEDDAQDAERYNTVFAQQAGSVAAPTAGLHFTPELLARLHAQDIQHTSVTLHVGMGTFLPVRAETLAEHAMHTETYHVSRDTLQTLADCRERNRQFLVVGTTSVRTLESLCDAATQAPIAQGIAGQTNLMIRPDDDGSPYPIRFTDHLLTNFHLPRSTLLALVAGLPGVGLDTLKELYAEAIAREYRFYSYGDAMLII